MLSIRQKRFLTALAFGLAALAAFCGIQAQTASADSMSVTLGPAQSVELWREVNGRQPEGLGPNIRAGRLVPGTVFTDHIMLKNMGDKVNFLERTMYLVFPIPRIRQVERHQLVCPNIPQPGRVYRAL